MTYFGPHERTVVLGGDVCTCGLAWPCPSSAEGRWAELRARLERRAEVCETMSRTHGQAAARAAAAERSSAYRAALCQMDELEAPR